MARKRRDASTVPELHSAVTQRFDAVERSVGGLGVRLDRSASELKELKEKIEWSMGRVDALLGAMGIEPPPPPPPAARSPARPAPPLPKALPPIARAAAAPAAAPAAPPPRRRQRRFRSSPATVAPE